MSVSYLFAGGFAFVAILWSLELWLGRPLPLKATIRLNLLQHLARCSLQDKVTKQYVDECVEQLASLLRHTTNRWSNHSEFLSQMDAALAIYVEMLRLWVRSSDSFDSQDKLLFKRLFEQHSIPRAS